MHRIAAVLLALALTACGGEPKTEEDKVREAAEAILDAQGDRDAEEYCSLMTEKLRDEYSKEKPCEDIVGEFLDGLSDKEAEELKATKATEVMLEKDHALARIGEDTLLPLRRVDGEWLLE